MTPWNLRRALLVDRLGFERVVESHHGAMAIRYAYAVGGFMRGGARYVTFELHGETQRNDEDLLEYRETAEAPRLPQRVEVLPSVERLARAFFETDERVLQLVRVKSETTPRDYSGCVAQIRAFLDVGRRSQLGPERWAKVLQIAWDRDEGGWRSEAEARAKATLRALEVPSRCEGEP